MYQNCKNTNIYSMNRIQIFALILLCCASYMASAQSYTIVDIRGEAVRASDGKTLSQGDQLSLTDMIEYGDNTMIALCSAEKGRAMVKGAEAQAGKLSDLMKPGIKSVQAESPKVFKSDAELKSYFSPKATDPFYNKHFVVIGDMTWYEVDDEKYPQDSNHFFFVRYVYDERSVNKGLPFDRTEFALERTELYSSAGKYLVEDQDKIELGEFLYYNGEEYRLICDFTPYFITKEELKKVVMLMKPWLDTKSEADMVVKEVQALIADMYGKAGEEDVRQFILRNVPEVAK